MRAMCGGGGLHEKLFFNHMFQSEELQASGHAAREPRTHASLSLRSIGGCQRTDAADSMRGPRHRCSELKFGPAIVEIDTLQPRGWSTSKRINK